jgi:hypothetical protein
MSNISVKDVPCGQICRSRIRFENELRDIYYLRSVGLKSTTDKHVGVQIVYVVQYDPSRVEDYGYKPRYEIPWSVERGYQMMQGNWPVEPIGETELAQIQAKVGVFNGTDRRKGERRTGDRRGRQ